MVFENLMLLHYVFFDHKIAVNFHLNKLNLPFTNEPSEMQKLPGKIMKLYHNWEVLELTENEFDEYKTQEKIDNVKGWLKEALHRQETGGIIRPYEKPI